MKKLTPEEIVKLPWGPGERWCLYNTETKSMFITSDEIQPLVNALGRMTDKHPDFSKLQLVQRYTDLSGFRFAFDYFIKERIKMASSDTTLAAYKVVESFVKTYLPS